MNPLKHIRRKVFGITQAEMARIVGVNQGTISRWENGDLVADLAEAALIRQEARRRRIKWDDRWFFEVAT